MPFRPRPEAAKSGPQGSPAPPQDAPPPAGGSTGGGEARGSEVGGSGTRVSCAWTFLALKHDLERPTQPRGLPPAPPASPYFLRATPVGGQAYPSKCPLSLWDPRAPCEVAGGGGRRHDRAPQSLRTQTNRSAWRGAHRASHLLRPFTASVSPPAAVWASARCLPFLLPIVGNVPASGSIATAGVSHHVAPCTVLLHPRRAPNMESRRTRPRPRRAKPPPFSRFSSPYARLRPRPYALWPCHAHLHRPRPSNDFLVQFAQSHYAKNTKFGERTKEKHVTRPMRTSYAAINNALWEAFYASRYLFAFTQQQNEYSRSLGYTLDSTAVENITWVTTT